MTGTEARIAQLYASFNARDVEGCLRQMTEDIGWPKASEGGVIQGKDEIRAYWQRQWAEFDPHVEPVRMAEAGDSLEVLVHQVVKSLAGELLFDGNVVHRFTLRHDLICRMELAGESGTGVPTAAFRR